MPDLLKKYKSMRDFGDTPEPSGGKPKKTKLPIFVIQKHAASHLHYDFRLEMEGVLKSWAVPKGPSYDPTVKRLAMMTEDHPYDYASFEGVIPAGNYGGGNVIIWDNGTWEFIEPGDDPVKAVRAGKLTFRMFGKKMFGEWALVKIHGRPGSKGNEWLLLKHRDEFANPDVDVTVLAPRSVVSNKTVDEIGSSKRIWLSNRGASEKNAPTLATKLEAEKKAAKRKTTKKRAPASPPTRSARAPKKAASSPSRSSRAGSPRAAAPTPRRRPR
jgi:bifunctional non-homologous end joining protein LigD